MTAYLDEWKAGEGPDNFTSDPPNATISVYESGNHENTLAVVKMIVIRSLMGRTWSITTS